MWYDKRSIGITTGVRKGNNKSIIGMIINVPRGLPGTKLINFLGALSPCTILVWKSIFHVNTLGA